jgi:hypothetical protein
VNWGRQNNAGTLLGTETTARRGATVDFRDQRAVYALYADYELVYVGQTGAGEDHRLFQRLKEHKSDHLSERWNRFSWFGLNWVRQNRSLAAGAETLNLSATDTLDILEAVSIAISEPRLNLQRGSWGEAVQYFQYSSDNESDQET